MKYQVYQITNKINGKIYIGKHQCSCKECQYFGSGKLLKRAIKKHGIDNFTKAILFEYNNEQDMVSKEKELVTEQFCSLDTNYNLCEGGKGGFGYINSNKLQLTDKHKEHYKKIFKLGSKACAEKYKDSALSDQHKKKISLTRKTQVLKFGHNWSGRKHTPETIQKMKESNKDLQTGSKNSQYGTMWITNGVVNKKIKKQDTIPEGYRNGRINTGVA